MLKSVAFMAMLLLATAASAQETRFFRIGTGGTGGTYFQIGGAIASAISSPPGAPECQRNRVCGVPGLIAVAQATQGSIENVQAMAQGRVESGLVQADIAAWAWRGSDMFKKSGRVEKLRAIAALFPESLHIVATASSGIASLKDLVGKRVSIGEIESGTLADARLVFEEAGIKEERLKAQHLRLAQAGAALKSGDLDAFFIVAGTPVPAVVDAAATVPIRLVPVPPAISEKVTQKHRYIVADEIPAGTYQGVEDGTPTVGTIALWVVTEDVAEPLVYAILKTLWQEPTQKLLESRHPIGQRIRLDTALQGIDIPLHPGAERFYREAGIPLPPPLALQ
jgi:TRAP transporter TAXI family solute receptor